MDIGNENNILFYNDDIGNIKVEVIMKDENVWLNTLSIAKLFNADMLLQSILIIFIWKRNFLKKQLVQKLHK